MNFIKVIATYNDTEYCLSVQHIKSITASVGYLTANAVITMVGEDAIFYVKETVEEILQMIRE